LFVNAVNVPDQAPDVAFFSDVNVAPAAIAIVAANGDPARAAAEISAVAKTQAQPFRWLGSTPEILKVVVIYMADQPPNIEFDEVTRKTRLQADFETLKQLEGNLPAAVPEISCEIKEHRLKYRRATLTVSMKPADAQPEDKPITLATIITGPAEYAFLSAGVPVNSAKQLKFDSDTGKVEQKETPKEFMVGLGLTPGDVFTEYPNTDILHRLVFNGFVRFSKQPLDSLGAALGYRWNNVTLFGGHFWTKEDVVTGKDEQGKDIVKKNARYGRRWSFGVGYNLDAALNWVKSGGQ